MEAAVFSLAGNTRLLFCEGEQGGLLDRPDDQKYNPDCEWKDGDLTAGAMQYCQAHQTDRDIRFFQSLPVSREITLADASYRTQVTEHLLRTGEVPRTKVLARAMQLCQEAYGSSNWYAIPGPYWERAIAELLP